MEEARRLAETAALIAASLTTDDIESFSWQGTPDTGVYQITIHLKDGDQKVYTVIERRPGRKVAPLLSPW